MHHNEKYWEEPFSFKPERFLDEEGRLLPANHPTRKMYCKTFIKENQMNSILFDKSTPVFTIKPDELAFNFQINDRIFLNMTIKTIKIK